jgi:bacillithiol synthase
MSGVVPLELLRNAPAAGFAADYDGGAASLARFYAGHPHDLDAYRRKATEIGARFDAAARARLASMLKPVSPEAQRRLDAVVRGEGFVVTTGQQAGLLGGTLFTIYKALSAVALADALQDRLGVPVLPVFWVASEDHDWAEVNEVHLLDMANQLHRLELSDPSGGDAGAPGPSMARRVLDERVLELMASIREVLPATDFRDPVLERAGAAYAPGVSVSDAFERFLRDVLADTPIATIQASNPELKRASVPLLRAELERGAEHEALLRARTEELAAAGYEPQVAIAAGAENVFYEGAAGRERLVRAEEGWVTRGRGIRLPREQALTELETSPERFSPNVLLRPVIESSVLPTLAYVGGPAEVRYFAQTGCLFTAHGVGMPIVAPRASLTFVEGKIRKVLDKFGLQLGDLALPEQELTRRIAADDMPEDVSATLKRLKSVLGEGFGSLAGSVKQVDPTLTGPVGSARNDAFNALADLEKRIVRALKAKNEVSLEQIGKARANLFPNSKPQERVLSPLQYLVRYHDFVEQARMAIAYELDRRMPAWSGVECP